MRSVTLSVLRTRCKQRADLENDGHISDAEWYTLLSEQVGELHELANECGMRYFETTATITATGASSYTLPTDHLATVRIWRSDTSGRRYPPLTEIQVQEDDAGLHGLTGEATHYAIIGQTIEFYPNPSSGTYMHRYIPQPTDLGSAGDSTSVDLICPAGEAFVVWGTAVKALAKSETDTRVHMAEREAARDRARTWLIGRSATTPRRLVPTDYGMSDPFESDPATWGRRR